ncbi:hypothetical protein STCU_11823 [Strigomonas culicis]|uniref:Alternative oxidase n=1 Tax=Strigomonas culicis TaxID=28005 RepID=S9TFJ2_9TRYP|nr:hypothetical protein STCU_11823 [Strigomonas culicis]|eukprot:EPY15704.1 hypothetical protein STCU_11823 [Strigomonas culicis]
MGFRLMGYLGEESAVVWTQMVNDIDLGKVAACKVPQLALTYWGLHEGFLAQEAPVPAVIAELADPAAASPPAPTEEAAAAVLEAEKKEAATTDETRPARQAGAAAAVGRAVDCRETLTLRDVILLIRSDERVFVELNHQTADALDAHRKAQGNVFFDSLLKRFK